MRSTLLAAGAGWRVTDEVCQFGPRDRAFEERHAFASVAAVLGGSFVYRSARGRVTLSPGALLLGNRGDAFECGHEHAVGDRCLAFHLDEALLESVAGAIAGVRSIRFTAPRVPVLQALAPLLADVEAARDDGDGEWLEELALRLAAAALTEGRRRPTTTASAHDDRRITVALRAIEERSREPLSLASLAREAAMSPYHFLRCFRALVGMTPHQYLLRTRLHRVATRLRRSREAVSAIAFDEGFNDLSTFNRRFHRVMGIAPQRYRQA